MIQIGASYYSERWEAPDLPESSVTSITERGYTKQQMDTLENPEIYRNTLKALENSENYISSEQLAEATGQNKPEITGFLDILRNNDYITGTVKNGEYFWNSKPQKLEWDKIHRVLDEKEEL